MFLRFSTVVLLIAALSINAEESTSCDKTAAYNTLRNMRRDMQIARASNQSEPFHLYNAMKSLQNVGETFKSIFKHCPESDQKQFRALPRLIFGLIVQDSDSAISSVKVIQDEQLMEEFVSLFYAVDADQIVMYITSAPFEISIPLSKAFINILERTNLNNTEVIPSIKLINRINTGLLLAEGDTTRIENIKNIMRPAIKANLLLQYDNIEELYKINKELTKEVIKELITHYASQAIESHEQLALYPLFFIIRCSSNHDIWIDNLNMVFETLISNKKLNSVHGLMLLKDVNGLLEHNPDNTVLQNIRSKIPDSMEKILQGNICVKSEEINKPNKIFLVRTNGFKVLKFENNEQGSVKLLTTSAGNFNFTIIVNSTDELPDFAKSQTVEKQVGNLNKFSDEEYCREDTVFHGCVSLEKVLPTGKAKVLHLGYVKEMAYYSDLVLLDLFIKNCGDIINKT